LVTYAASLVEGAEVEVLDLNDYELPLFSVDKGAELGRPELSKTYPVQDSGQRCADDFLCRAQWFL
jgi:hypothetical protein